MTTVFIVEDEPLISLNMEAVLRKAGFEIAACAGSLEQALVFLETGDCDVGVLDANLRGESVERIATVLEQRGRPFLLVSGYGRLQLPSQFHHTSFLPKPFKPQDLVRAVREISA
jgi:DNA-binding NtrC family response regulator